VAVGPETVEFADRLTVASRDNVHMRPLQADDGRLIVGLAVASRSIYGIDPAAERSADDLRAQADGLVTAWHYGMHVSNTVAAYPIVANNSLPDDPLVGLAHAYRITRAHTSANATVFLAQEKGSEELTVASLRTFGSELGRVWGVSSVRTETLIGDESAEWVMHELGAYTVEQVTDLDSGQDEDDGIIWEFRV